MMTAKPDKTGPRNSSLVSGKLKSRPTNPLPYGLGVSWLFALWGVGVVFEASRGSWTVSWDDDRTQELASGASSTKTRTQFGYPNFVQHPKTLQFRAIGANVVL